MVSIKKFFKKNLRDIATVVGFAVGGWAGAAVGQGIGSLGEGRDLKKSVLSAGKVYTAGQVASGFGVKDTGGFSSLNPFGKDFLLKSGNLAPGATGYGKTAGSFLEGIGGALRGTNTAAMGTALKGLPLGQKALLAGQGLNALGAFDPMEQPNNTMPAAMGGPYLTQGLRPATVSDVYGTGNMRGLPSVPGVQGSSVAMDPINMAYMELLRKQQQEEGYGDLAFPEFSQQPIMTAKTGGIARLADGGELPEVDLRFTGGGTNDPNGSGDKDTIPALLADGEFVMTKQAVKGIGNGNHDQGIAMLYAMMDNNENKAQQMGLGRA
jgi:hypothetical protein